MNAPVQAADLGDRWHYQACQQAATNYSGNTCHSRRSTLGEVEFREYESLSLTYR